MIYIKLKKEDQGPFINLDDITTEEMQFFKPMMVGKKQKKGTHNVNYIDGPKTKEIKAFNYNF